jgi:hypothetical protein
VGEIPLLELSGLTHSQQFFYCRAEDVELWRFVKSAIDNGREAYVSGSPGCGKSSLCWDAFIRDARPGAWIHLDRHGSPEAALLKEATADGVKYAELPLDLVEIRQCLAGLDASRCRFVVLDGVNRTRIAEDAVSILKAWHRNPKAKERPVSVLFVKSGKFREEKSETIDTRCGKLDYHIMSSWTLDSYRAALVKQDGSASELLNQSLFPRKRDSDGSFLAAAAVNAKYYYAGGSARWMFAYSTERIQQDVAKYLSATCSTSKSGLCRMLPRIMCIPVSKREVGTAVDV